MSTRRNAPKNDKRKRTTKSRTAYEAQANEFLGGWAAKRGLCLKKGHSDSCRCDEGGPVRLK